MIGVLAKKGQSANGQDYDDAAFMPVSAYRSKISAGLSQFIAGTIFVRTADGRLDEAQAAVSELLRQHHARKAGDDDDFFIRNLTDAANALGARPRDVLGQFLAEAAMLPLLGGAAGVALGVVAAAELAKNFGWSLLISPGVIAIAVGFSAFVGVAFGLYPALSASRLDPIQALRHE